MLRSVSNDDVTPRRRLGRRLVQKKFIFISEIRNCLDLFSAPMALKCAHAKYAMTAFSFTWKFEKFNSRSFCSLDYAEFGHSTFLFCRGRQRNVLRFTCAQFSLALSSWFALLSSLIMKCGVCSIFVQLTPVHTSNSSIFFNSI